MGMQLELIKLQPIQLQKSFRPVW